MKPVLRRRAYILLVNTGIAVGLMTVIEMLMGQEAFLFFLYVVQPAGLLLVAIILVIAMAAVRAALRCRQDVVLFFLGVVTIPYAVFAADNVLYFFEPFVVANDTVEAVSIGYSLACLLAALVRVMTRNEHTAVRGAT